MTATPISCTGKERDETALDNFVVRYFSSPEGRFTSPDPLLLSAKLEDPQTWNRYTYARNNPLKYNDPTGLYSSPAYDRGDTEKHCLNDEQRRILENSRIRDKAGKTLSGQALYNSLSEKQQNAFVNTTDRLASVKLGDGSNALSHVSSLTGIATDRVFANVGSTLADSLQQSSDFKQVGAGMHGEYSAVSFKDVGVMLGNIQFSFNQSRTGADIDIDIGNMAARNPLAWIVGAAVHTGEVVQNKLLQTTTDQDHVRRILLSNPKIQTITPSPDPRFNR